MKNDWIAHHNVLVQSYQPPPTRFNGAARSWKAELRHIRHLLMRLGRRWVRALIGQTEPQICRMVDRQGITFWYVYDPGSQAGYYFESEDAVRVWLEQRYS